MLKSQQNRIELVTRPGAYLWIGGTQLIVLVEGAALPLVIWNTLSGELSLEIVEVPPCVLSQFSLVWLVGETVKVPDRGISMTTI